MSADWKRLSRDAGFNPDSDKIEVPCGQGRSQVVNVDDSDADVLRLWSTIVVRRDAPEDVETRVWKMNRYRELVGFKVVEHGRVIGEAFVPAAGLATEEWELYVRTLARSCDQLEYLWTGRDAQ